MENAINILKKIWMVLTVVFRFLKSKFGLILLTVLAIIGGFTYISYRNYIKDLPIVTLTSSEGNQMRSRMETTGSLYYNEELDVTLPQGCRVEEVFVTEGDAVEDDMPLIRIKLADLQVSRLNKQMQIEALEEVEEEGGTEGELAYWEKELLLEEVAELEKLIAAEGIVKAEGLPVVEDAEGEEIATDEASAEESAEEITTDTKAESETASDSTEDGEETVPNPVRVISQTYKKGDWTNPDVPITLGLPQGGCYLEWQISAKDYKKDYKATARIGVLMENLTWDTPEYENGAYTYRSLVAIPDNFVQGQQVKIELNYVSEGYKAVLPKTCIRTDADGSAYVYQIDTRTRNYGEERYVRKIGVTILEQDATNVAILASLYDVVEGSSKQLQDMMAVMVIEE